MNSKPELIIKSGLPGSGKSTAAKAWVAEDPDGRVRVNYDDMRRARFGPKWVFNRKQEDEIKAAARQIAETAINSGLSVVIDNTNLSRNVRAEWTRFGEGLGATVVNEEHDTPIEMCISRDRGRLTRESGRVGRAVIERMALQYGFLNFQTPSCSCSQRQWTDGLHNGPCAALTAREFVIVDIDGTVADCEHRLHHIKPDPACYCTGCGKKFNIGPDACPCDQSQHLVKRVPKDWKSFFAEAHLDKPIKPICKLASLLGAEYDLIFLTGRDTSIGIETEDWLDRHGFNYAHLFMRASGDHRQDFEIKLEVLEHIPKDRVAYILEDRDQVVKAYRAAGYTVLQVKDGSY